MNREEHRKWTLLQFKSFHHLYSHHGIWSIITRSKYFPVSDWLLFTKFGKNFVILNQWRRKCNPLQSIESLTFGDEVSVILGEQKNKELIFFFKTLKIFWINDKAVIEFGFRRIWRILQTSEGVIHLGLRPLWITPSLICRILHIPLSLIQ